MDMATNPFVPILRHARRSAVPNDGEPSDGLLLDAFLRRRDSQALEALVERHAPMVWGICRRALAKHHDAEDAFQATFLVLLRKAASIRSRELLANWLYGVAYKTARKAKQMAEKRDIRENPGAAMPEPQTEPCEHEFGPELRTLLDEELSRLPEKYRIAVLLCDLEGRSRAEAARHLGVPEGTVASRQARGRALLAKRLSRRGVTVSATALATGLSQQASSASVPAALLSKTKVAATLLAAGGAAAAGAISADVSTLTEGVLRTMALAKYKAACVLLLTAALVLSGGLFTYHLLAGQQAPTNSLPIAGPVAPPHDPEEAKLEVDPKRFGNAKDAARFAVSVVHGGPAVPGIPEVLQQLADEFAKATFDPKTKHWRVTGSLPQFRGPAIEWEAEVSYSPFGHAWQCHTSKPRKWILHDRVRMPVTFAELRSMPEMFFLGPGVTDEDLRYLHGLEALRTLHLCGRVTDIGLDKLRDLPNLRTLILTGCSQITDKGLVALQHLPDLETLDLSGSPVTDECLKYVASLRHLRDLNLANTEMTGEGFRYLDGLHELHSLNLFSSSVPLSLKEIKHLKNLEELNLARRRITNQNLKDLKQLKSLAKLDLTFTGITDADLAELQDLKSLKSLTLTYDFETDEPIVDSGPPKPVNERVLVRKFREAMKKTVPGCVIDIQYDPKGPPQTKGREEPKKGP
jgi:RNA polymerase sigma factor (sigma-70 family)